MEINVKTKIGNTVFEIKIDEAKEMEALHKAIVLGNLPQYCHECNNTEAFRMDSNKDKEANIYVNVVCEKCGAKSKLGQYKSGGYFWHKFEKYIKPGGTTDNDKPKKNNDGKDDDDLPF